MAQGKKVFLGICVAFFLFCLEGCDTITAKTDSPIADKDQLPAVRMPLATVQCKEVTAGKLIVKKRVNGKIAAFEKVDIKFEASGRVIKSGLKNGQSIAKGVTMALLDDRDLQYKIASEKIELEIAENSRAERMMLVSGGQFGDTSVSAQQHQYINIVSGYNKALQALEETTHQLTKTRVIAPFNGYVADLRIKENQYVNTGEVLCVLINPDSYEAQFDVTEELALTLDPGQNISVSPLADPSLTVRARINSINPLVDDNGLVTVNAPLAGSFRRFFEGMNIQVKIEQPTPSSILIPKEALVMRSGREVVFIYDNASGRAKWKFVTVGFENDEFLGITDGLNTGDLVITSGNLNLDHDTRVELEQ